MQDCVPWLGLTSACPPGDRTLWQCSHFRQKRCQFLPRELTFSAVGNKGEPGCGEPSQAAGSLLPLPLPPSDPPCFLDTLVSVSIQDARSIPLECYAPAPHRC